ncbi:MAG TPA: diaminopimelate epimerase [Anaeromyxobacteraceae bacterium]
MALRFWKYHGLGNDFVVVEGPPLMTPERAFRLCDRRRGVGGDGVLTVLPPEEGGAAAMHIYNSDGSVAAMCGNGIRCVARHVAETRGLEGDLLVETDSGVRRCTVHRGRDGAVEAVTVDMGTARLEGEQDFEVGPDRFHALRVNMGNPHAVIFEGPVRPLAESAGPAIERLVPGGVNVGFAQPAEGGLDLAVWERGAGLTDACGTGACAAAVAAVRTGRIPGGGPVAVRLPGGVLEVTVGDDLSVRMKGPAERVFEGETDL